MVSINSWRFYLVEIANRCFFNRKYFLWQGPNLWRKNYNCASALNAPSGVSRRSLPQQVPSWKIVKITFRLKEGSWFWVKLSFFYPSSALHDKLCSFTSISPLILRAQREGTKESIHQRRTRWPLLGLLLQPTPPLGSARNFTTTSLTILHMHVEVPSL